MADIVQTSVAVAVNDTLRIIDHNSIVTDLAAAFPLINASFDAVYPLDPGTLTPTYSGRKLTQIAGPTFKWVITWAATQNKITTIQYYNPLITLVHTYTPTYVGRYPSVWTRS
jgi:hypothetical protein